MKISESLMTILMVLAGILPFILFTYIGRKASGKSKKKIAELLKKENQNFTQKEFWNHNFIGIDERTNSLLFIKLIEVENQILKIDLSEIKTCQIIKTTRDYKIEKKHESELQTLGLELNFLTNKPKTVLNFYDINDKLSEQYEMMRAEKWHQLIVQNISKNKLASHAA